jgi:hypothetical protein
MYTCVHSLCLVHFTAPLLALIIAAADAQSKKMTMMKIGAKIISFE